MPFKLKLIKNIKKHMANYNKQSSEDDQNNQDPIPLTYRPNSQNRRKFVKSVTNIYQVMLQKVPFSQRHVVNLFNVLSINQEALKSPECQETYFRTLFYSKNIKKVVSKPRYIVLHLIDSDMQFPPLQYTIERFKSFGDEKYYRIAVLIQKAAQKFDQIKEFKGKEQKENHSDQIEQYVDSLGSRMFYCKGGDKIFLSKSFLQTLEYDPQIFQQKRLNIEHHFMRHTQLKDILMLWKELQKI